MSTHEHEAAEQGATAAPATARAEGHAPKPRATRGAGSTSSTARAPLKAPTRATSSPAGTEGTPLAPASSTATATTRAPRRAPRAPATTTGGRRTDEAAGGPTAPPTSATGHPEAPTFTRAALAYLRRLAEGEALTVTYGPWSQLVGAGLIDGPQEGPRITPAGTAYLAGRPVPTGTTTRATATSSPPPTSTTGAEQGASKPRGPRKAPAAMAGPGTAPAAPEAVQGAPKAPPGPTSWGLFHRLQVPGRGRPSLVLRLVVEDVPAGTKGADVLAALEAFGDSARYSEGGIAWGNHQLLPAARWPELLSAGPAPALDEGATRGQGARPERRKWAAMTDADKAPDRRVTLALPAPVWARLTLAASAAGLPLQTWARQALEAAAAHQ